jgi:hypothetical protein
MKKLITLVITILIVVGFVFYLQILFAEQDYLLRNLADQEQYKPLVTGFRIIFHMLLAGVGFSIIILLVLTLSMPGGSPEKERRNHEKNIMLRVNESLGSTEKLSQELSQLRQELAPAPQDTAGVGDELREIRRDLNELGRRIDSDAQPAPDASAANDTKTVERLLEMNRQLNECRTLRSLMTSMLEYACDITGSGRGSIFLISKDRSRLFPVSSVGWEVDDNIQITVGEGICGTVANSGETILVEDIEHSEEWTYNPDRYTSRSFISVPVFSGHTIIGVMNLTEREAPYHTSDSQLIDIIRQYASLNVEKMLLVKKNGTAA